jgi:hypothetical protein
MQSPPLQNLYSCVQEGIVLIELTDLVMYGVPKSGKIIYASKEV